MIFDGEFKVYDVRLSYIATWACPTTTPPEQKTYVIP